MLKRCTFLLFCLLIVSQLYVCGVHAGDKAVDEECNTSSDCEKGLWCKPLSEMASRCQLCLNNPKDRNDKDCNDTGANCEYTDHGDSNGYCPWELTCDNGTVFVPDGTGKSGACKTCNEIIENANNHYVSNLGANRSYIVMWNGTNFSYMVEGVIYEGGDWGSEPVYPTENPAICVGKPYEVNINCTGGTGCPTKVYRQYGNETDWWKTSDINDDNQKITKILPIPTRKRHEFKGYYLDNTQIFDEYGRLKSAGNTITGPTTLFAKWVVGGTYTITIQDNCGDAATFPAKNCQFGQDCALNVPCSNTRYDGNVLQWSIPDNCGTISSDSQTFYLSDTCNIDKGDDLQITLTCTSCPANSYCNSCQQYPCPQHTISNAGSVTRTDCKFDPNTQFNDSVGSFTLPAGSNITIKWDL